MIKILWKLFKNQFIKYYISDQCKPITHAQMKLIFIDSNGKKYYEFDSNLKMPLERNAELLNYKIWMQKGLSVSEFDKILDKMDSYLTDGLKNNKGFARIGALIEEMRTRRNMAIPRELWYNFLAVQIVREDEMPEVFNNEIQREKVDQLKMEVEAGNSYDFFMQSGLMRLLNLLNMSKEEFEEYWLESGITETIFQKMMEIYSSDIQSGKSKSS